MSKFISILNRNRSQIINIITILIVTLNLLTLYFILNIFVTSNDECIWRPKIDSKGKMILVFDNVKYEGVSWQAGIENGDVLVKINNKKVISDMQAQELLNSIEEGDYAKYTIERKGELIETKVFIKKLISYKSFGINLLALFWILISYFVLKSNPFGTLQIAFYKIGIMLTFVALYDFFTLKIAQESLIVNFLLALFFAYGVIFLPFKVIEFFWIFPNQFKILEKKLIKKLLKYGPQLIYISLFILFIIQISFSIRTNYINLIIFFFYNSIIFAFFVALISLFINYFRLKEKGERKKILTILIGFTIGMLTILYINIISNIDDTARINNPEYFIPIILLTLTPISFAYSIFKYSLLDVSEVIKNAITYGLATISIGVLYFFTIYFLGQSISSVFETDYQGLLAGVLFVIFALVFQSTKDKFQYSLTKRFYPAQFEYQNELINFSNEVVSLVGFENIINKICFTFSESLKIEKVGILIKDKRTGIFKFVKHTNKSKIESIVDINGEKIIELIDYKKNNKQLPLFDKNEFSNITQISEDTLEGFYTIVPMIIQNKIIGILLLGLKPSGSKFTYKEMKLLGAFSNQASISIENSLLYEAEADNLKIQRDLENARKIQNSLLPAKIPSLIGVDISACMISAEQVGGDYYDVIKINENSFYAVVGDVSGKGLAAAFYMTKLQTLVRLFINKNLSPKEILLKINQNIIDHIEKNSFITISLAHIDLDKKIITFCRAGHTQLIILRKDIVTLLKPIGIGVGLSKNEIFGQIEEVKIEFEKNDIFLMFSDGVTEEMNEQNEMFGIDKLSKLVIENQMLKSSTLIENIVEQLKIFRKSKKQNDDITIVSLKF